MVRQKRVTSVVKIKNISRKNNHIFKTSNDCKISFNWNIELSLVWIIFTLMYSNNN